MKIKTNKETIKKIKICVVGLGYVGLPLVVKFGETQLKTYGLDINTKKIDELKKEYDAMGEVSSQELKKTNVEYTTNPSIISKCNFIIVAVPTPVNDAKQPDITLLQKASKMIGGHIQKESIVIYESTVYPGCTMDDCVPIIDKISNLKCGKDWFVGYSPERVNPGDKEHTIDKIVKVVSGMNKEVLEIITKVYEKIITAGVHKASSIEVAEAAKVIENTQRDINIALMNELAIIFDKIGISTKEALEAAGTKWNFLKFTPGLVGGHCIGVDPYYLVHKAEQLGIHPEIITAGRKINDNMPLFIANQIVKMLISTNKSVKKAKLLILGLTFKENVNDMRNSKAKELIQELKEFGIKIYGHDPHLTKEEVFNEFNIVNITKKELTKYKNQFDGIIHATAHNEFKNITTNKIKELCNDKPIFYDIKAIFDLNKLREIGFKCKDL